MSFKGFFGHIIGSLESTDIPYMLTGSLAASFHGAPRATQDVDLVIEVGEPQVVELCVKLARAGYYVSDEAAREAVSGPGQFNVIDPESGWKADFIVRKPRAFSRTEFERRQEIEIFGKRVWIVSAEDLVVAKLEWATLGESERQLRDVAGILKMQGAELDSPYINRWVTELGLTSAWESVQNDVL